MHTADNLIRLDLRVSTSFGTWVSFIVFKFGGEEASVRASCFRLGRRLPVLDGAIVGGSVDLSDLARPRLEEPSLYEGEIFE